jgi:hypothetical protein
VEADQTQTPVAEPVADAGAASEVSASAPEAAAPSVDMNDVMRQVAGMAPASKPDAQPASADDDGQDEASAPDDGASKSSHDTSGISRRKAPQRIAELEAENQRLQSALAEVNPPPPDPDEERRKAYLDNETRFRSLIALPDDDPRLAESDNWSWLQEEKRRRAVAPELAQQYETALEAERQRLEDDYARRGQTFLGHLRSQVKSSLDLPGIEPDERTTLETTTDWLDHVLIQRAAERRVTEARFMDENARLRKENEQLRRESFGRARVPVDGGRATGGPSQRDMNEVMRQIAGVSPR